jgi:endo-1,3-1,4-beta-glycanase ExoK
MSHAIMRSTAANLSKRARARSRGQRLGLQLIVLSVGLVSLEVQAQETQRSSAAGSFFDDFKSLDRQRWYISDGWSNGDIQGCTWSGNNIRATGGSIELTLNDDASATRRFACAELQSLGFYGYGTYEVRMRSAVAHGLVTAFFTYTGPPHGAGRPHDEIDFEFLGKAPRAVQLNFFANARGAHERMIKLDFDASATINDYAFEWGPEFLRWFINGKLVHEVKGTQGDPLPSRPSKIILSIWNGGGKDTEDWLGRFSYPGQPLVAIYEYVAFTAAGASCQFPTSVVCSQARGSNTPR